jgi:glyoxylate carboligase
MSEQLTVADYIVRRLAREGITDCFGVAGDFAFKLCDAVARSEAVRWIGCSNELDAAYAADGYARVRGCSMLLTTYAVGELSALNGVSAAYSRPALRRRRQLRDGQVPRRVGLPHLHERPRRPVPRHADRPRPSLPAVQ